MNGSYRPEKCFDIPLTWSFGPGYENGAFSTEGSFPPDLEGERGRGYIDAFEISGIQTGLREAKAMQKGIHPKYMDTVVKCGCGNSFRTRSTQPELKIDICSSCHPFFTGKLKYIDTAGRIEKFKNKFAGAGYASLGRKKAAKADQAEG